MKRAAGWTVAIACAALAAPVQAQTMYKCGKQYQDRPCEAGQQGRAMGSATSAPAPAGASVDAECARRGSDSMKIVWSREGGATAEKLLAEINAKPVSSMQKADERKLVQEVYEKRGSAPQIRAAIEADCLAEKERAAQAAALAAAAARLAPGTPAPATAAPPALGAIGTEQAGTQQAGAEQRSGTTSAAANNSGLCRSLASDLERNRASQRKGGSTATMERLQESARYTQARMRDAGC